MKKFVGIVSLTLVMVMLFTVSAFAASVSTLTTEIDKDNRTVKVSGTVSEPVEGQQATIMILKGNVDLSSLTDDDIAYIDQVPVSGGKYEFNAAIAADKGDSFTVYVGGSDIAAPKPQRFSFTSLSKGPGDCNGDGVVNLKDYMIVLSSYNTSSSDANFDPMADLNGDNVINLKDYMEVLSNYNKSYN